MNLFESKIRYAVEKAKSKGYTIVSNIFGVEYINGSCCIGKTYCCPIGALLVDSNFVSSLHAAAKILSTTAENLWMFVDGFDGNAISNPNNSFEVKQWYDLGCKFRKEYNPSRPVV
jgi:hypothetical protein